MKLKSFALKNFRGYQNKVHVEMNDLTVFVSRYDIRIKTQFVESTLLGYASLKKDDDECVK